MQVVLYSVREKKVKYLGGIEYEDRKCMGEAGREYIKNNFSRDIVIKAYLEKINSLCK